jgi:hypothetical protein
MQGLHLCMIAGPSACTAVVQCITTGMSAQDEGSLVLSISAAQLLPEVITRWSCAVAAHLHPGSHQLLASVVDGCLHASKAQQWDCSRCRAILLDLTPQVAMPAVHCSSCISVGKQQQRPHFMEMPCMP